MAPLRRRLSVAVGSGAPPPGDQWQHSGLVFTTELGGPVDPRNLLRAVETAARRAGADVYPHTMVTGLEAGRDGVTVRTPTVEFQAPQVVVAAGAWLGTLVPGLPLAPRRTPQYWFRPEDPRSEEFTLDRFPAFIWERHDGGGLWGHGSAEDFGIKIGPENAATAGSTGFDPEEMDRYIHLDTDVDRVTSYVAQALPGLEPRPAKVIPCVVTDSPDEQFLVGRLAGEPRVVVAGGDSGHGFKHAAGIGELLAQIVTGERPYCATGFMDPARFPSAVKTADHAGQP